MIVAKPATVIRNSARSNSQLPDLVPSLFGQSWASFGKARERRLDVLHLLLGELLKPQQAVARLSVDPDEFIELELKRPCVAVLGVFWIRNTIRKVTIVVPVLMMSCHVSDHRKIGPLTPHTTMMASASANVAGRPAWRAVQWASLSKPLLRLGMRARLVHREPLFD
jgi:hypothetical protein